MDAGDFFPTDRVSVGAGSPSPVRLEPSSALVVSPVTSPAVDPVVSIIVPVYNEERTVLEILRRLEALPLACQVIVVDDGSTDQTPILLGIWQERHGGLVLRQQNRGKGAAVRAAFPYLLGAVTVIQDADLELDPDELPGLLEPVLDGTADVVYGSRFLAGDERPSESRLSRWGNAFLNRLANRLYQTALTDLETCYKVIPTAVLQRLDLQEDRFGFEPEVTAQLCCQGLAIHERPISYQPRTRAEGKKIRWRDGLSATRVLLRVWLRARRSPAPQPATAPGL